MKLKPLEQFKEIAKWNDMTDEERYEIIKPGE